MKLDRNDPEFEGRGKYALLLIRKLNEFRTGTFGTLPKPIQEAIRTLDLAGLIDWGEVKTESEFFVLRLKDENARHTLLAYATACKDLEFADEVRELADRAGYKSRWCKEPD